MMFRLGLISKPEDPGAYSNRKEPGDISHVTRVTEVALVNVCFTESYMMVDVQDDGF